MIGQTVRVNSSSVRSLFLSTINGYRKLAVIGGNGATCVDMSDFRLWESLTWLEKSTEKHLSFQVINACVSFLLCFAAIKYVGDSINGVVGFWLELILILGTYYLGPAEIKSGLGARIWLPLAVISVVEEEVGESESLLAAEEGITNRPSRMEDDKPDSGYKKTNDRDNLDVEIPDTAHQISRDSWFQVGFVLTTGINSAYVLGYSGTIMVPLGWVFGVVGLIVATAISLYANTLIAKLHEFGGKRHIRYRDLAGFIYGRKAYALTWFLQYVNLFMINVGFIILAGQALKAIYVLFRDDHVMKLPYFTIIAGFVCAIFAIGTPHLSALRVWLGFSTFFSLVYIVVAFVLSLKDGIKAPPRDYSIPGTTTSKIFTTIGASANLVFAFNTGMLPEIQATVRQPVVKNMLKALYFQFTVGVLPLYAVTFMGYWAYGSSTSFYLLNSVNGPAWVKVIANLSAFFQTVVALHIFASPMYEYLDTKFGIVGSALAIKNLSFRIGVRGGYLALTTFVAALLPFLGDFMSLTGAVSTFPLTFILANHMYLVAKKNKLNSSQKMWHWLNVCFFGLMSCAAAIAAFRLIAVDSKTYHVFADL